MMPSGESDVQTLSLPTGATVALDDSRGGGTVILFSHGYMMNRSMFAPQLDHFASRWRCIAWDARAHGDTIWEGPFDYWDSARDMLAMMDALGLEKVIHVGMSQGGLVGMRAALLAPERFHGLVQLSTQVGEAPKSDDDSFPRHIGDWIANGPDPEKLAFLSGFILGPGVDHSHWHDAWSRVTKAQVRDATGALASIDPLFHRLHEVTMPVAVIHGLADLATSHELGLLTAQGVPDPRVVTLVPGGPHAVNLSNPRRVNRAIEDFILELASEDPTIRQIA